MIKKTADSLNFDVSPRRKLRVVLIFLFVIQIFLTTGLIGYLSFRNGQNAINQVVFQWQNEIVARVEQRLRNHLSIPHMVSRLNADSIALGNLDIHDPQSMKRHFWQRLKTVNQITHSVFGSAKGEFFGARRLADGSLQVMQIDESTGGNLHFYATDEQGNSLELLKVVPDIDPRGRPWYLGGRQKPKPISPPPYPELGTKGLILSAPHPVYKNGEFLGVTSSAFLFVRINTFLQKLTIGKSGQVFIMERSGLLISTSTPTPVFNIKEKTTERIKASESENTLVRSAAQHLEKQFADFTQIIRSESLNFDIENSRHFLQVSPFQDEYGLDWLIVVMVPESHFMEPIAANTRVIALLAIIALVVAILIGLFASQWIAQPILSLTTAAKKLAAGQWEQNVPASRFYEVCDLAGSFMQMRDAIRQKIGQLEELNRTLEQKVEVRTRELRKSVELQQREIVERKRIEEELLLAKEAAEAANKAKSVFLANMSHELRSPLNAILGFAQVLNRSHTLSSEDQENIGIIRRSGEHLLTLINQVLDLSKIEAGGMTLNAKNFDLFPFLHDVQDMFALRVETKGLQLLFEQDENVPRFVRTDEVKLRQVLINLLNNAIKFTEEGGVAVRVRSERFSDLPTPIPSQEGKNAKVFTTNLHFEIEDSGLGIAPEEIEKVFEAFGQTETGRQSQEGTGLGLPISRKFVQLMGGDMWVKSDVGHGTLFTFDIQAQVVNESEMNTHLPARRAIALGPGQPCYRILIVDDRWTNRQLVVKLLNPFGFELREAVNGQEAIEIWETWKPHLIWMDMRMPVLDGYEATKRIKAMMQDRETTIIALTASSLEEERAVVLNAGCDDYLRKPFREAELFELMSKHIGVKFEYEEEQQSKIVNRKSSIDLAPEALAALPEEWLAALKQGAEETDVEMLFEVIEQIRERDTTVADALARLAENFEYDEILALIRGGD